MQTLYNEVELYKEHNPELKIVVEEQIQRLIKIDRPKELDVVPLRQILVDLYPPEVLVSKASYELELLWEYVTNDFSSETQLSLLSGLVYHGLDGILLKRYLQYF